MHHPIITLTTDFGISSPYVAQMKGAILQRCRDAVIVDITHAVPPQDIQAGAIALRDAALRFPLQTMHIAVVDPGVGSDRRILYVEAQGQRFIGPDNGLLSLVAPPDAVQRIIALSAAPQADTELSATFHGRDIMAPAAAAVAAGEDPARLGQLTSGMVQWVLPAPVVTPTSVTGVITHIDSFGNAISNLTRSYLDRRFPTVYEQVIVEAADQKIAGISRHYAEGLSGHHVALFGSSGYLEIAQVNGSAADSLGIRVGGSVVVRSR